MGLVLVWRNMAPGDASLKFKQGLHITKFTVLSFWIDLLHGGETLRVAALVLVGRDLLAGLLGGLVAVLVESLSSREREVLRCLADGLSNKEIAQRLGVSEGTIKNHLSQIFGKLGAADRTQAALYARELGLWSG